MRVYILKPILALVVFFVGVLVSVFAYAEEHYYIAPSTIIYVYQERDIYGLSLDRTRSVQNLVLSSWTDDDLIDYKVFLHARVWGEFGMDNTETQALAKQGRIGVELLSATLEFPHIFNVLNLRLGRLVMSDAYGLNLIDGAELTLRRNWFWGARVFIGSPVRTVKRVYVRADSYPPPDYNPFEAYSIDEGSLRDRSLSFGTSLFLDNVSGSMIKLSWRRSYADWPANSIESDILSAVAYQSMFDNILQLNMHGTYNLFAEELSDVSADVSCLLYGTKFTLSYSYSLPVFPSWSIFSVFPYLPFRELAFSSFSAIGKQWSVYAGIYHRLYDDGGLFPTNLLPESQFADEIRFGVSYMPEFMPLVLNLSASANFGYGGEYGFATIGSDYKFSKRAKLQASATLEMYGKLTWLDELYSAHVVGVGGSGFVGISYFIVPELKIMASSEYISTPILARDFRVMIRLEIEGSP